MLPITFLAKPYYNFYNRASVIVFYLITFSSKMEQYVNSEEFSWSSQISL